MSEATTLFWGFVANATLLIGLITFIINTNYKLNKKVDQTELDKIITSKMELFAKDISTIKSFVADIYTEITGKTPSYLKDK